MFRRNNGIWRKGLLCKSSSVASNQVYNKASDITKDFEKRLFSSTGLFMDWKLQTVYIVDKHDFLQWISVENTSILSCLPIYFFVCSGSNFSWNFRVLWGVLTKSWQERHIQFAFLYVCRYLSQRVRRIGE